MNFLSKIFGEGAKSAVAGLGEAVGNVVSKFKADPTKVIELEQDLKKAVLSHEEKLASLEVQIEEAYLKDVQDARKSNVDIQTSEKVPLFTKIVPYIIDCFVMGVWGFLTIYVIATMMNIIKRDPSINFEGVMGVYAGVTGIAMVVLNFHRGSSKSSEEKQKFMQKMMEKE